MARLKDGLLSGALSDLVVRKYGKELIVCTRPGKVKNPRTPKQQKQRSKFVNLVNCYQHLKDSNILKNAFEELKDKQTYYSRFIGLNLSQRAVYLTQEQGQMGWSIVAPYIISQGSLIGIGGSITDGTLHSNISLGNLQITDSTTVKEFARAIIRNNENWKAGDELWWVSCEQKANDGSSCPWIKCTVNRLTLSSDSTPLSKAWNAQVTTDGEGFLCHATAKGGYTFEHRRTVGDKTSVSTQMLVVDNPLFEEHNTPSMMNEAVESWGKEE